MYQPDTLSFFKNNDIPFTPMARQLHTIDSLIEAVNSALPQIPFPTTPARLYDPIRYALSAGGKRIRPVLMLMAYNLYKDDPTSIMQQALALETYHNFTLLHDDLIDKSDLRRGQPTVHKKWDENTAILSGDTMLAFAYRLFGANEAQTDFSNATLGVLEGEDIDIEFETRSDVTESEYMEMIRLKTALLLAYALKIGARLAGAPESDQQHLYAFGEKMGLAFQVQDDLLDVYADSNVFKKKLGGDIVENKKTYLLIQALNRADAATKLELNYWLKETSQNPEDKIAAVTQIYDKIGIPAITQQCIEQLFADSLNHLEQVQLPTEDKLQLRQFAQRLMGRDH